jgi:hypothetical protein
MKVGDLVWLMGSSHRGKRNPVGKPGIVLKIGSEGGWRNCERYVEVHWFARGWKGWRDIVDLGVMNSDGEVVLAA